jgi:hypothetical protein
MSCLSTEIHSMAALYKAPSPQKFNLGGAILLAAIADYRCMNEAVHRDAALFLYPQTPERQNHYEWVVAMAEGTNAAWLRDALDRSRPQWDRERFDRTVVNRRSVAV